MEEHAYLPVVAGVLQGGLEALVELHVSICMYNYNIQVLQYYIIALIQFTYHNEGIYILCTHEIITFH